jgi:hypothetical protein
VEYKPSGTLKKFVDVAKKQTRVIGSVERHVLAKPTDQSRRTDVLHPSEMASPDWCYRASYFQLLGHSPVAKRNMSLRLYSVFEEGHYIHAKWQKWLQEMGTLYGKWHCEECGEMFWGGSDCHEGPLTYREVPLFYAPLRISGHSDGWLVNLGEPLMLEIKSVGMGTIRWEAPEMLAEYDGDFDKIWKALKAPFMKHITQVQIYMKLAELLQLENHPQEAVIIYENKATQEVKEFVIPKSDFGIEHLFEAAKNIVAAVDSQTPIACNIAPTGCSKCKGYENE